MDWQMVAVIVSVLVMMFGMLITLLRIAFISGSLVQQIKGLKLGQESAVQKVANIEIKIDNIREDIGVLKGKSHIHAGT